MVIGRRVFTHNWFERSMAELGESQGNGGFLTALAVPLIASLELLTFTIGTVTATLALAVWGIRRSRTLCA